MDRSDVISALRGLKDHLDDDIDDVDDKDPDHCTPEYVEENPDKFKGSYTPEEITGILENIIDLVNSLEYSLDISIEERLDLMA